MSANGDNFYRNFRRNEDKNFSGFEVPDSGKAKEGRKKSIRGEERIQREKGRRTEGGNDGDRRSIVHPVSQSPFDWITPLHGLCLCVISYRSRVS